QCIANDRYRAQRHGGTGNHRAEQQPEHRIERASGNRDTDGVIDEREEEILPNIAHGAPAEVPGTGNAAQVPLDEGHTSALIATSVPVPIAIPTWACARAGASLTPSPAIATTWPSACRRFTPPPF